MQLLDTKLPLSIGIWELWLIMINLDLWWSNFSVKFTCSPGAWSPFFFFFWNKLTKMIYPGFSLIKMEQSKIPCAFALGNLSLCLVQWTYGPTLGHSNLFFCFPSFRQRKTYPPSRKKNEPPKKKTHTIFTHPITVRTLFKLNFKTAMGCVKMVAPWQ